MAGAISGTTIAAIAAMVAGAALNYKAQTDAAKRREAETRASLARQAEFQRLAEKKALSKADEFTTDNRANQQQQIEQKLTEEFTKPVESAQDINNQITTTQGAVSDDYLKSKAESSARTMDSARKLASLFAKTTAAGRLRNNEAIGMADAAAGIDRLGNFSRGQMAADQIAIQNAGTPDAGMQLAGGLLSAAGSAGLAGAFGGASKAAMGAVAEMPLGSGMSSAGATTGIGSSTSGLGSGMWGLEPSKFKVPSILVR